MRPQAVKTLASGSVKVSNTSMAMEERALCTMRESLVMNGPHVPNDPYSMFLSDIATICSPFNGKTAWHCIPLLLWPQEYIWGLTHIQEQMATWGHQAKSMLASRAI